MGSRNPDRVPRLAGLQQTPPHHVRMAACLRCGHEAPLPVAALIHRHGPKHPVKWALMRLRCTACGAQGVTTRLARLCTAPCPRAPRDPNGAA